ncbi:MAG: TIM barrel protein [Brevibacterium sp.]|uniref:hydroxypyruvate isomerase family protein n=1 Tax=Brevibacterium sp. TaxID=1701 RepID=UPI002649D6FB|nr:TIM barrel protein [Brevibacterium sp.]MDN5807503.1 TIM barrel protein [Brevibacterium sp.]MDN5833684.1 TIM barrel protein [Brevibacterium sp.]MDN5877239.1 TIM barrel protein [Brevibacterium sp.]MDN5911047.1 TIM barrel protein [Brevibacterium sp.]MDN6158529.1 TIM barrel protein [Brevibacterium sp.]
MTNFDFTNADSYILNCSTLLTELPVMERAQAAKDAGFSQVEFWWPFDGNPRPTSAEVDEFIASLDNAGVELKGLNFWAGNMGGGDRGMVSIKGAEADFAANVDIVVEIGRRTGCRAFNALYGLRTEGQSPEEQDEVAIENLKLAADAVAAIEGTVLVEPVSGAEDYPLKRASDAAEVVQRVRAQGVVNVAVLADFFHMSINGDDVAAVIEADAAKFGHIQIADAAGRGAPGTGELPLQDWINRSYELGYTGSIALEYKQDRTTAFQWLAN